MILQSLRCVCVAVALTCLAVGSAGCGDGNEAKTAKVTSGPMPEGETWTGVYYHPVFGYLHMQEEGDHVVAKWKRTDHSYWGSLSGTLTGNVLHYTWTE